MAERYARRRRFSAIAHPPLRGYVFVAIGTNDQEGVHIDRHQILGVAVCTESTWAKQDTRPGIETAPFNDEELRRQGFAPESEHSTVVPLIFYNFRTGEAEHDDLPEEPNLCLMNECGLDEEMCQIVWCPWPQHEDEHRLESVVRRLRERFLEREARRFNK